MHKYNFTGKPAVSNMSGGLFLNRVQYHQKVLALFVQSRLGNFITIYDIRQGYGRQRTQVRTQELCITTQNRNIDKKVLLFGKRKASGF